MRFYVCRTYSRGSGRKMPVPRGFTVSKHEPGYDTIAWHKKEFDHRWLRMLIWNNAALQVEGGVIRGTARRSYYHRHPRSWVNRCNRNIDESN